MAVKLVNKTNFTAGELSPRLMGHVDNTKYANGLKEALNGYVLPHGPFSRRNGTAYIAETKDSSKASRLLKFQFDITDAYIIEMGENYLRFYKNGEQVISSGSPYEIATTYTQNEIFDVIVQQQGRTLYLWHSAHPTAQLVWTSDTSWELSDVVFSPPVTYEDGYTPNTTITPAATTGSGVNFTSGVALFLAADVGRQILNLSGTGIAVITSISSTTVAVCDIIEAFPSTSAISAGNWKIDLSPVCDLTPSGIRVGSIINLSATKSGELEYFPSSTVTPGATTGAGVTFTAASSVFLSGHVNKEIHNISGPGKATITAYTSGTQVTCTITENFTDTQAIGQGNWKLINEIGCFRSSDIGRYVLINNGVCEITAITSAVIAKAIVLKGLDDSSQSSFWSLEEELWTADNGYPGTGLLHQERLFSANIDLRPTQIWGSEIGIFESMGVGSNDTDAVDFKITAKDTSQISWLAAIRGQLAVGTTAAEITVDSGNSAASITPTQIQQQPRGSKGSLHQQPISLDDELIYIHKSRTKIQSFKFDYNIDNYISEDLTFLAEHLPKPGVKELCYVQDPDRNIFAVLDDGSMLVCTYIKEQQVNAWCKYTTQGAFESVNYITDSSGDQVYVIVKRTVNGVTKRYVEVFDRSSGYNNLDGFSDSYITQSNPINIVGITNANPCVVTATAHGFTDGDVVRMFDVGGMTQVEGQIYKVVNATTDTFELQDETDASYIDSSSYGVYTSGGQVYRLFTVVSGLSHLEGMVVQIKADGATHEDKTVSGGQITLDRRAYETTVGLSYTWRGKIPNIEFDLGEGSQQGQQVRWVNPIVRLLDSALPTLNGMLHPSRYADDLLDASTDLVTGDFTYPGTTWSNSSELTFESSYPLPCTLVAIFGSIESGRK